MDRFDLTQSSPTAKQSNYVHVSYKSGVLTILPAGPTLGERETMMVAAEVRPWLARHSRYLRAVVIDLSQVHIMSSFGLGWCIEVRNAARLINVKTVLVGLNNDLSELVRMMKVDRLYTIVHDRSHLPGAIAA